MPKSRLQEARAYWESKRGGTELWQNRLKAYRLPNGQQTQQREDGLVWVDPSKGAKAQGWVNPESILNEGGRLGVYTPPTLNRPAGTDQENLVEKDRQLVLRLGMKPEQVAKALDAPGYKPGEIAAGLSDPNGFYRKYLAGADLGIAGGLRRGVLSIDSLLASVAGNDRGAALADAKRMVSQAERNEVAGRSPTDSGRWYQDMPAKGSEMVPGMVLAEGLVPGIAPVTTFPQRLAMNSGKAGLGTFLGGQGDPEERAIPAAAATVAAPLLQVAGEKLVTPLVRGTINAMKGWVGRSATPNVSNIEAQMVGNLRGRAGTALQDDLENQYLAARARGAAPFQELRAMTGEVDLPTYKGSLEQALDAAENSRSGSDPAVVATLRRLKEGLDNPKAPKDWASALDLGSHLNATIGDAMKGQNPNRNLVRILEPLKKALQSDMDTAGAAAGSAYKDAKATWLREVVPWEDPTEGARFLKNFMNNPTPNDAMRALSMMGPDKARIFLAHASPQGKSALQAGLVQTAFEDAQDPITRAFVPQRFLKAMNDRQDVYSLAFKGEAKWKMDGFMKLMKDANFIDHFLPGKWGLTASQLAEKLFTTKAGSNFLIGASDLNPTSKAFSNLVNTKLPVVLGISGGRLASRRATSSDPFAEVASAVPPELLPQ